MNITPILDNIDANVVIDLNNVSIDDDVTGDPTDTTHRLVVKVLFNLNDNEFHFISSMWFILQEILWHHHSNQVWTSVLGVPSLN